jgi:oleandomycin transport system ATP-binding protein
VDVERGSVLVPVLSDEQLTAVVGAVTERGITLSSITTELPSLDEVFLSLTGHRAGAPQGTVPAGKNLEEVAV